MKNLSELKVIAAGILIIVVVAVLLAAICAGAVVCGLIPETAIGVVGALLTLLAAVSGGVMVGKAASGGALPKALGAAAGYLFLVFVIRGIMFGTVGEGGWRLVLAATLGAVVGVLLAVGRRKKHSRR